MRSAYSDVVSESPRLARETEGAAFDIVLAKLDAARGMACDSRTMLDALDALERLWTILLRDMAQTDNALTAGLRAKLVSIAVWTMREITAVRGAMTSNIDGLIAVNAAIRAGLR